MLLRGFVIGGHGSVQGVALAQVVAQNAIDQSPEAAAREFAGRRNGLIDRSKTPFALINADDYEVVQ